MNKKNTNLCARRSSMRVFSYIYISYKYSIYKWLSICNNKCRYTFKQGCLKIQFYLSHSEIPVEPCTSGDVVPVTDVMPWWDSPLYSCNNCTCNDGGAWECEDFTCIEGQNMFFQYQLFPALK